LLAVLKLSCFICRCVWTKYCLIQAGSSDNLCSQMNSHVCWNTKSR
jgi:hypothetical protein